MTERVAFTPPEKEIVPGAVVVAFTPPTNESTSTIRADSTDEICVWNEAGMAVRYAGGGPRKIDCKTCVNGFVSLAAEAALSIAAPIFGRSVALIYWETICEIDIAICVGLPRCSFD